MVHVVTKENSAKVANALVEAGLGFRYEPGSTRHVGCDIIRTPRPYEDAAAAVIKGLVAGGPAEEPETETDEGEE